MTDPRFVTLALFSQISVPPIGWLIAPIGFVLAVAAPRTLFLLAVAAVPFSATAVVNFGGPSSTDLNAFGLQAAIFLGGLWMAREAFDAVRARTFELPSVIRLPSMLLLGFTAVAALSLVMPVIIDGAFLAREPETRQSFIPLILQRRDVTQALYLGYGALFAVLIAIRCQELSWRRATVRAYVAGGSALAIWGWIQFALLTTGHSYPRGVFNTNIQHAAQGSQLVLDLPVGTVHRLSSGAVEPSIFAQVLLTIIPLVAIPCFRGNAVFSRRWDALLLFVIAPVLLLSTATTAYVGVVLLSLVGLSFVRSSPRLPVYLLLLLVGLVVTAVLAALFRPAREVLYYNLIDKADTWSAAERFATVKDAWWSFAEYPLLGTGWGTAPTQDLVVYLLGNTGITGFVAFGLVVVVLLARLRITDSARLSAPDSEISLVLGVRTSLIVLLVLNVLTGFAFVFGHVWVVLGLAIACTGALRTAEASTLALGGVGARPPTRATALGHGTR